MRHTVHMDHEVAIELTEYARGGVAIQLWLPDGEAWDTATTWIPGLGPDEVAIRDDDLPGRAEALAKAEIIFPKPVRRQSSGWITIPVYRLVPGVVS